VTIEKIQALIAREIEAIQNIPTEGAILKAVEMIYQQVHIEGGKVVVSGMGKAGQIGINIATTLSSTGTPAIFVHPAEAQHGDLGTLQNKDIILAISNSGKTREVIELEFLVHRLYPHMKFILLTGNPESDLAKKADLVLSTGGPDEICPLGLTPTTSTTVMTVAGDILVVLLMEKIGFTKAEYAKRHHSGYLGQKAKEE
jgi:arabinose-5-phosphate isomerase